MSSRNLNMYLAHKKWETVNRFEKEIKVLSCKDIKLKMNHISDNIKDFTYSVYDLSGFSYLETQRDFLHVLEKQYNSECK